MINPETTRGPVRFLLGQRVVELHPGEKFVTVADGPPWRIRLHRGGTAGEFRAQLQGGSFEFHVTRERGWTLAPRSPDDVMLIEEAD